MFAAESEVEEMCSKQNIFVSFTLYNLDLLLRITNCMNSALERAAWADEEPSITMIFLLSSNSDAS